MKRLVIIVFGFLYSIVNIWAQPYEFKLKLDNYLHVVKDMIQTNNNNYIIAGTTIDQSTLCVTSLSEDGEILWSRYFPGDMEWFSDITEKSNGNILIPMGDFFGAKLLEIDPSGDSVNYLSISEINRSFFSSIIEINDTLLIAAEIIRNSDLFFPNYDSCILVKMDKDLNIHKKIPSHYKVLESLTKISDDNFFAIGRLSAVSESYLIKYNLQGEIINNTACSTTSYQHGIYRLNNNFMTSIGYQEENKSMKAILSKFDLNGEIEYCKSYINPYFLSVTKNEIAENIFTLGNQNNICTIYKLDYAGNLISSFSLNDPLLGKNIIYAEGYLYISGNNNPSGNNYGSYFIKINADSIFSTPEYYEIRQIIAYPNPAKEVLNIYADRVMTNIELYNLFGQLIKQEPVNAKDCGIETTGINPGIYLIKIEFDDITVSQRIVIE